MSGSHRGSNGKRGRDLSDEPLTATPPSNKLRLTNLSDGPSSNIHTDPIAEANVALTNLQRFIADRSAHLKQTEEELAVRQTAFDDNEHRLVERAKTIEDRECELKRRESVIKHRERDLNNRERCLSEQRQALEDREHLLREHSLAVNQNAVAKSTQLHKDMKKPEVQCNADIGTGLLNRTGDMTSSSIRSPATKAVSQSQTSNPADQKVAAAQGETRSVSKSTSSPLSNDEADSSHSSLPHVKVEQDISDTSLDTLSLFLTFQSEPRVKHEVPSDETYQTQSEYQSTNQPINRPAIHTIDQSVKQTSTHLAVASKSVAINQTISRPTKQTDVLQQHDQPNSTKTCPLASKSTNNPASKQSNNQAINNTQVVSSVDRALQQENEAMLKQIAKQISYLDCSLIASTSPARCGSVSPNSSWDAQVAELLLEYPADKWDEVSNVPLKQQEMIHFLLDGEWRNGVIIGVAQTKQILKMMQDDAVFSRAVKKGFYPIGGLLLPLASFVHASQLPPHHEYCYAVAEKKNDTIFWYVAPMIRRGWISKDGTVEPDSVGLGAVAPPKHMLQGRKPSVASSIWPPAYPRNARPTVTPTSNAKSLAPKPQAI